VKISKARIKQLINEEIVKYSIIEEALGDDTSGTANLSVIKNNLEDYFKIVEGQDELIKEIVYNLFNDDDTTNDDDAQKIIKIQKQYKEFLMQLINSL
jgi:hypothetical protein